MAIFNNSKDMYIAPIGYLIGNHIREYDISKANINILLYKGLISKRQYDYYYNLPKKSREIKIGLLIRDNQAINKGLREGFGEMRKLFYQANNVQEYEVLAVKKDAIYLIGQPASITKFKNVEFLCKNHYTSFYRLGNGSLEFYYYLDTMKNEEKLDVKGISDNMLELHQPFMLDFLKYIFSLAQLGMYGDAMKDIQGFYKDLITGNADIGYYRELNNRSLFRSRAVIDGQRIFFNCFNSRVSKRDIDVGYNIGVIQELFKIISTLYLKTL